MSPSTRTLGSPATASRNASSSLGRQALLGILAGGVDLDEAGDRLAARAIEALGGRERRERVHEAHAAHQVARLAALQVPDEVPREALACDGLLGQQLLDAVLAHERDARVGEHGQVGGLDVLDGCEQLHRVLRSGPSAPPPRPRPHAPQRGSPARRRARRSRAPARELRDHGLPPAAGSVAPVGVEAIRVADRAQARRRRPPPLPRPRARGARPSRDRPGRPRRRRRRSARAAARRRRRRPRSSRRRPRARRTAAKPGPTRPAAASSTPAASPRQPAWTTASRLPSAATSAAVRQSAPCAITGRPGSPVTRASPSGHRTRGVEIAAGDCAGIDHDRAVPLAQADRPRGVGARRRQRAPAVLGHPPGVVRGREAEVERREAAVRDAALPRRERDLRARAVCAQQRHAVSRLPFQPHAGRLDQGRGRRRSPRSGARCSRRRSSRMREVCSLNRMNSPKTRNIPYWSSAAQRS